MTNAPHPLRESPSQTAGPYVHIGCVPNAAGLSGMGPHDLGHRIVEEGARGERTAIRGVVMDGLGAPLTDALVEIWHADAAGRHPGEPGADPLCHGFGRAASDPETGEWRFETVRPGAVPAPDGRLMAPHASLWIVARGINLGLHTRLYFPEDEEALARDPLLSRIEHRARAATLIAAREGPGAYRFDVRLQGEGETVFLDV